MDCCNNSRSRMDYDKSDDWTILLVALAVILVPILIAIGFMTFGIQIHRLKREVKELNYRIEKLETNEMIDSKEPTSDCVALILRGNND